MSRGDRAGELADAALRIVLAQGLSGVSFRSVATESGWSLGAVQKTFATKNQMLEAVVERAQQRVVQEASQPPGEPDVVTWLVELMLRMLPLDAQRRAAVLVGSAYADKVAVDGELAQTLAGRDGGIRGQIAGLIGRTRRKDHVSSLSDEDFARAYLALAAGWSAQLLYDERSEEEMRALATSVISAMLVGSGHPSWTPWSPPGSAGTGGGGAAGGGC